MEPQQEKSQFEDLTGNIEKTGVEILNMDPKFSAENCIFNRGPLFIRSEKGDPQLLINISFTGPVKIHHMQIRARDTASRPTSIKVYVNQLGIDFSSVEDSEPTQEFELDNSDYEGVTNFKYVKFQHVKTLTIFVEENNGAEFTSIQDLIFYGQTFHGQQDMKGLKPVDEEG
mmetsp:Transcript_36113/g.32500  ORF Transcript_36113/g.32500 Transcript_36113/m.32500 type:complete len:172 (-) Transcript_36113:140-655(-)